MRHQRRGPHIIAAVGTVVGAAGTGNAVQHLLVFGGMFRVVFDPPLQRFDISAGAAAFIAIRHFQQIAAHHPAGTAQHIISHQIEHRLRHGIVGTGQQIDPQRHIGKQRFAVAVGIQLISVAMEGVIHLNGFVSQPATAQIYRQIFGNNLFELRRILGDQRPIQCVLGAPQGILTGTGGAVHIQFAQDDAGGFVRQHVFQYHADAAETQLHTVAVLPPVDRPGAFVIVFFRISITDACPIGKCVFHSLQHRCIVIPGTVRIGIRHRHRLHPIQRQIRFPCFTVGRRFGAVIINIRPATVGLLNGKIFTRARGIALPCRGPVIKRIPFQKIGCQLLSNRFHLLFLRCILGSHTYGHRRHHSHQHYHSNEKRQSLAKQIHTIILPKITQNPFS